MIIRDPVFHSQVFSHRSFLDEIFPFTTDHAFLFGYSRYALYQGFRVLGLQKSDSILIPEYICDTPVWPARWLGLTTIYYRLLQDLTPDWEDVRRKLGIHTRAFLIVNYFGFPNDLYGAQAFCRENDVWLVEDNAHGFLSYYGGCALGSFGDISVVSFRKTLPMPNGSALIINNPRFRYLPEPLSLRNEGRTLRFIAKRLLHRVQALYPQNNEKMAIRYIADIEKSRSLGDQTPAIEECALRMSELGRLVLRHFSPSKEIIRRRRKYNEWSTWIKAVTKCRPLFPELKDAVAPQVFPVFADSATGLIRDLRQRGIESYPWPFLPKDSPEDYLSEHVVCLPLNEGRFIRE